MLRNVFLSIVSRIQKCSNIVALEKMSTTVQFQKRLRWSRERAVKDLLLAYLPIPRFRDTSITCQRLQSRQEKRVLFSASAAPSHVCYVMVSNLFSNITYYLMCLSYILLPWGVVQKTTFSRAPYFGLFQADKTNFISDLLYRTNLYNSRHWCDTIWRCNQQRAKRTSDFRRAALCDPTCLARNPESLRRLRPYPPSWAGPIAACSSLRRTSSLLTP